MNFATKHDSKTDFKQKDNLYTVGIESNIFRLKRKIQNLNFSNFGFFMYNL